MSTRNGHKKIGNKFAEEMQLVAEEKWILDALNKIKKQRNCLQIERLQLESLKTELISSVSDAKNETSNTSTTDLPQNKITHPTLDSGKLGEEIEQRHNFEMDCNMEELNLLVTTPVLTRPSNMDLFTEEEESDDDDNVAIDINMLMNGIEDENME